LTTALVRRLLSVGPVLALGAGLLGFVAPRSSPAPPQGDDVRQIYLRDCATCHGADGNGTNDGPSLEHDGPAITDYMLTTGRMPLAHPDDEVVRKDPKYDAATITALVDYVASLHPGSGQPVPKVDLAGAELAEGGEDFRLACAACHQAVGQGGALRYGEAPSLARSTPTQVAEAMRTGPGTMPVFGEDEFNDQEVAGIAAYVRYLQDPNDRGGQPLWHFGPLAEGMVAFLAIVLLCGALAMIGERR
jgi:ubiquinol-cytochrome c reductase cytochrome c subunit